MRTLLFELFEVCLIFTVLYGIYRLGCIIAKRYKKVFDKMDQNEKKGQ